MTMRLKWNDWTKKKAAEPGVYLIWSHKKGLRLTKEHPSWWNREGERVRLWIKVADLGIGIKLRAALRRGSE
jgi:hypothetical protein